MTTHSPFHDEDPHHPPANTLRGYMMAGETPPDSTDPKECSDDHPDSPLLPLVSTGCGCCAPATPSATTSTAPVDAREENDETPSPSAVYQVAGMTCGHCARHVTEAVHAVPQVNDVHIDLQSGGVSTVTVTGAASPETVRQAIDDAGYAVLSS